MGGGVEASLLARGGARIAELQEELARDQENARQVVAGYNAKIAGLEQEGREKTQWALRSERRDPPRSARCCSETDATLEQTEKELQERTAWALRLEDERRQLVDRLDMVRASRWVKLGRKVGIGPAL